MESLEYKDENGEEYAYEGHEELNPERKARYEPIHAELKDGTKSMR
jgi:hypothetical protein